MTYLASNLTILPILAAVSSILVAWQAWRRRHMPGAVFFSLLLATSSIRSLGITFELSSPTLGSKLFWSSVQLAAMTAVPGLWLLFSIEYSRQIQWARKNLVKTSLILLPPIIVQVFIWSDNINHLLRISTTLIPYHSEQLLSVTYNPKIILYAIYGMPAVLAGFLIIGHASFNLPEYYRKQASAILIGALFSIFGNITSTLTNSPFFDYTLLPLTFVLTSLVFNWALNKYGMMAIVPVTRTNVVQGLQDSVFVLDQAGFLIDLNKSGASFLNKSPGEVIGCPGTAVFAEWPDIISQINNQQQATTEFSRTRDEHIWAYSLQLNPLNNEEGRVVGRVMVLRDISLRFETEIALRQATTEAESAVRAKAAFLANMSHEIRTPLNAVVGMTELLRDTQLTNEQRELVETVYTSSDALLSIINNILDFSKIESGKLELETKPFDLQDCIQVSIDIAKAGLVVGQVELTHKIDADTPIYLKGDVIRLRQILVNLLGNAVKFTSEGSIHTAVSSSRHPSGQVELHFSVTDTGIGIPPDRVDHIFTTFSQADSSTTRKFGGTGLGLAISKNLIELMGGHIWVESQPGKGSTFHFNILTGEAETKPVRYLSNKKPRLHGKRLLILTQSGENRRWLSRETRGWGMTPYVAASPPEALYWIKNSDPFDLGLIDRQILSQIGPTLLNLLRKSSMGPNGRTALVLMAPEGQEIDFGIPFVTRINPENITSSQLNNRLSQIFAQSEQLTNAQKSNAPLKGQGSMSDRIPLRILLAEDNKVNQMVATRILKKLGYETAVVSNGREAVDAAAQAPYDVILMDIQMPEMDGVEATNQIQKILPNGHRPYIIAMTANALEGDREHYLDQGMDNYVSKPIQIDKLIEALHHANRSQEYMQGHPNRDNPIRTTPPEAENSPIGDLLIQKGLIDLSYLEALLGTDALALLPQLLPIFLEDGHTLLEKMRLAIEAQDGPELKVAAHTLKGSSASLGMRRLADLSQQMESAGETQDFPSAINVYPDVESEFSLVKSLTLTGLPAASTTL